MIRVTMVVVALLVVLGLYLSLYTVSETEQVVITQFGQPIGDPITEPGLHSKLPLVQQVNRFEKRWLEWDGAADEMPTKEKTYIWVDVYARWRIKNALKFFESVFNEEGAQSRLDDIIDSETRNVIAAHDLKEVVRLTNRKLARTRYGIGTGAARADAGDEVSGAPRRPEAPTEQMVDQGIEVGRSALAQMILEKAQKAMPAFGIELVDVQFQRVNYTKSVEEKVFLNMISERQRIAERYRSEGKGESERIRGEVQEELLQIESEGQKRAELIMGTADAEATAIYARAHNRDPELYELLRSLDAYRKTVDEDTLIIMSTESDFFRRFTDKRR